MPQNELLEAEKVTIIMLYISDRHSKHFAPEREPVGFFPSERSCPDASKYKLPGRGGSIPNSAVIKMLYPHNLECLQAERQRTAESYRPPVLNAAQLAFISQYKQQVTKFIHSSRADR